LSGLTTKLTTTWVVYRVRTVGKLTVVETVNLDCMREDTFDGLRRKEGPPEARQSAESDKMATRLDGFYLADWVGLNQDGAAGGGVVFVKDGTVYGGDHVTCFVGKLSEVGGYVVAQVTVFPRAEAYRSVTGIENKPWELPDIRSSQKLPEGAIAGAIRRSSRRGALRHASGN
jgi:hypothetical protein